MAAMLKRDCGVEISAEMINEENVEKLAALLCAAAAQAVARPHKAHEFRSVEYYKCYVKKLKDAVKGPRLPAAFIPPVDVPGGCLPSFESHANVFVSVHDARRWLQQMAEQVAVCRADCLGAAVTAENAGEIASAVYRSYFLGRLCAAARRVSAVELARIAGELRESLRVAVALVRWGRDVHEPSTHGTARGAAALLLDEVNLDYSRLRFNSAWQVARFVERLRHGLGDAAYRAGDKTLDDVFKAVNQLISEAQQGRLAGIERCLIGLEHERMRLRGRIAPTGSRLKLSRLLEEARAILVAARAARGE